MTYETPPTDLSTEQVTALLVSIPGAWWRAQEGLRDARAGLQIRTPVDDLLGSQECTDFTPIHVGNLVLS